MTKKQRTHTKISSSKKSAALKPGPEAGVAPVKNIPGAKRTASEFKRPLSLTREERYGMIAELAYCIAEERGFQGERMLDDWLQAEAQVDALLSRN